MPVGTYILRKYHSKMSDVPASQFLATGNLTVDTTRGGIYSTYILTKGTAASVTLASPLVGKPEVGGQDGFQVKFICGSAVAHLVSTSAGFNGAGAGTVKATFGAALGNSFTVEAYNGAWYTIAVNGATFGTA
jgi:hypothetical protein